MNSSQAVHIHNALHGCFAEGKLKPHSSRTSTRAPDVQTTPFMVRNNIGDFLLYSFRIRTTIDLPHSGVPDICSSLTFSQEMYCKITAVLYTFFNVAGLSCIFTFF